MTWRAILLMKIMAQRTIPEVKNDITEVATSGAALRTAILAKKSRRALIDLIVRFEDAMLQEMRRHPSSASLPIDSYVKFYCKHHMESDPIPENIWHNMVQAVSKSMERVQAVNVDTPWNLIFGGFEANELLYDRSDFVDSAYGTASNDRSRRLEVSAMEKLDDAAHDYSETETHYSSSSTIGLEISTYMEQLALDLSDAICHIKTIESQMEALSELLPDLLKQFALRIGQETQSKEGREVMFYVHQNSRGACANRVIFRRIATLFRQRWTDDNDEDSISNRPGSIPYQEDKVLNWAKQVEPAEIQHEAEDGELTFEGTKLDNLDRYQKLVAETSAYDWLVALMTRELTHQHTDHNTLQNLRNNIRRSLPIPRNISRRKPPTLVSALFTIHWDLTTFVVEQYYNQEITSAFTNAIALTGSPENAQALPCIEYLKQTWPSTGDHIAGLLQKLVSASPLEQVQGRLRDGSKLTAWISPGVVCVEVTGNVATIVEVGEQLAWLGAALRISPFQSIGQCRPYVQAVAEHTGNVVSIHSSASEPPTTAFNIRFSFDPENLSSRTEMRGRCWYDLFKNPVLVRGFPVLRRRVNKRGLELPLNLLAGLVGATRAHIFHETVFIKGFSAMLVPSERDDESITWHLFHKADGSHISYLDNSLPPLQHVGLQQLYGPRHIVGWAPHVQNYTGRPNAQYDIKRSRLPPPGADCILEKCSIIGGKFITGGFVFAIGVRDSPVHISRKPYVLKLRWLWSKFVILWDTDDKRGWLVRGTDAVLHLLRASLKQYESDAFRLALLSKYKDIFEPVDGTDEGYSISVLRDERNMKLPIYPDKDELTSDPSESLEPQDTLPSSKRKKKFYRIEDKVEEFYEILEQLVAHQVEAASRAGVKIRRNVRSMLDGWDFSDLIADKDPIYPRVAVLNALGRSWVDFTRSIQALTLLGSGFGEVICSSFHSNCRRWTRVPKYHFYLTACVSDIKYIMEEAGDHTSNPRIICEGISWHSAAENFQPCRCKNDPRRGHSEFVQTLWPSSLRMVLRKRDKPQLPDEGAVIFGHNIHLHWKWEDIGNPIEGDPDRSLVGSEEDFYDSGIGVTESSSSAQRSTDVHHESENEPGMTHAVNTQSLYRLSSSTVAGATLPTSSANDTDLQAAVPKPGADRSGRRSLIHRLRTSVTRRK